MNSLSLEKMDTVNFLLTEVSLELLGNTFYDVYGDKTNSLNYLVSRKSAKKKENYTERSSELLNALNFSIFDVCADVNVTNSADSNLKQLATLRKRRASVWTESSASMQTDTNAVEESLLEPMIKTKSPINNARKITRRRFTCLAERPRVEKQNSELLLCKFNKPASKAILDRKVEELRKELDMEFINMKTKSEISWLTYARIFGGKFGDATECQNDFYKDEEKRLLKMSNTLIEFVKFIKSDGDNANQMSDIARCILTLKETV